ncbi:MAG TPA: ribosome maturation factor RimM, partial [Albitalea sp.]|nr:ribosome maturation factor RimM [Albitalea sp.]
MTAAVSAIAAGEPAWPDDAVEVGRILDAWGVKGWIKVQPFAADPQALFSSRRWFLKAPEASGPKRPVASTAIPPLLKITQAKEHGDWVVAQAQDVPDRSAAEALRGA